MAVFQPLGLFQAQPAAFSVDLGHAWRTYFSRRAQPAVQYYDHPKDFCLSFSVKGKGCAGARPLSLFRLSIRIVSL